MFQINDQYKPSCAANSKRTHSKKRIQIHLNCFFLLFIVFRAQKYWEKNKYKSRMKFSLHQVVDNTRLLLSIKIVDTNHLSNMLISYFGKRHAILFFSFLEYHIKFYPKNELSEIKTGWLTTARALEFVFDLEVSTDVKTYRKSQLWYLISRLHRSMIIFYSLSFTEPRKDLFRWQF